MTEREQLKVSSPEFALSVTSGGRLGEKLEVEP